MFATGNRDEALDLVQDAMMRLASRYADKDSADWPALFFRILNRRIIDWHRRERLRRLIFFAPRTTPDADEDLVASLADPGAPGADHDASSAQVLEAVCAGIAALPERQQQAFLLRELAGFDVGQTAEIMQCSAGSVKTHYARAREKLRHHLQDQRA